MYLLQNVPQRITDSNGVVLDGVKVYTYVTGTTTNKTAYTDQAGTTPHPNPIILGSDGVMPQIWLNNDAEYRIKVTKSDGTVLFTWDDISGINLPNSELQDTSSATKGSGLVKHNATLTYAPGTLGDKLIETYSVCDYPWLAVGDGVTDDISAIRSAFAFVKGLARPVRLVFPAGKVFYVSGGFGTDRTNATDFANDVEIYGYGATLKVNASALPTVGSPGYNRFESSTTLINLEGNNVAVRGLKFTSTRTIDHTADPESSRDPLILGVVIGGKSKGIWNTALSALAHYKSGSTVEDCQFEYINSPIYAMHTGALNIRGNRATQWTETGIVLRDVSTDCWVENNNFVGGADDCFAALHYDASPYGAAGTYAGRLFIRRNTFTNTFAKCCVVAGYSDVHIEQNFTDLSAGGNIVWESGSPWADNRIYNRNLKIIGNTVRRGGRYFNTSYAYVPHQSPVAGEEHGIHGLRNNDRSTQPNVWQAVEIAHNTVENPRAYAIAAKSADYVFVTDNTCISDTYDHGAGAVGPNGSPIWSNDIRTLEVKDNKFLKYAASTWAQTYHIGNTNIVSGEVVILDNKDYTGLGESFDGAAGTATQAQIRWQQISARYELRMTRADDGLLLALVGNGGNLQVYQATGTPPRIYNSTPGDIVFGVDNTGSNTSSVGVRTSTVGADAAFEVGGTSRGMKLPTLTTAQRDAISSPRDGLVIYNSTIPAVQARVGAAWVSL